MDIGEGGRELVGVEVGAVVVVADDCSQVKLICGLVEDFPGVAVVVPVASCWKSVQLHQALQQLSQLDG